jgi:transcriptional regulator with XRE-family HTH domain
MVVQASVQVGSRQGKRVFMTKREPREDLILIGRRIKAARDDMGFSQQQVINKLCDAGIEITQGGYGHWESGRTDIPSSTLVTLARVLKTDVRALLGQTDEEDWVDESPARFYNGLSPEDALVAKGVLRALFKASDAKATTHGHKAE